jgi:hypothetical protein
MIVSHVSAPHNPCQDDNVRHQALTAPNPSLNSWLCVSLSRTNTQWCARMTAGGSSAPASSVFTTATELVGSDISVRCPPVSFLPSGHSHTAQPSTLSTQLLRLKQYSSTPALQHSSTPALTTTRTIINCDLYRSPIYFQNNITRRRERRAAGSAQADQEKQNQKIILHFFVPTVKRTKGQKDKKKDTFFFKRSQT